MQLWKYFTASSLRSACLAMNHTTMETKGRQLQRACKTKWLSSETTVRARSEILAILGRTEAAVRTYKKSNVRCFTVTYKNKNFNVVFSFCQYWHFT